MIINVETKIFLYVIVFFSKKGFLLCLRTQCVDLGQEQWVFIHLFCKKYCVVQKIVVPLHRQKVNRLF